MLYAALESIHKITGTIVNRVIAEFAEEANKSLPEQKKQGRLNTANKKLKKDQVKETIKYADLVQRIISLEEKIARLEATIEKLVSHVEL
jgi:hypothetical protein